MGLVYRAEDVRLRRPVALKFLPPELTRDESAKERFIHEAQAASALDHPNICTIHEVEETPEGQMFIAMAFCDGETLRKRIERGPLSVEDALDVAIRVCDGLAAAHGSGVIHRDIKPGNIMVRDAKHVRIVDFGLAKLAGEMRLTKAGTVLGTVDYMAPEQARGDDVDSRADIWALGVVLYEMLVGHPPFKGENQQAIIYSILHSDPEPVARLRPDVPADLGRVIERCLKRDPAERFQAAADLQAALDILRGDTGSDAATRRRALTPYLGRGAAARWAARLRPDPRKSVLGLGAAVAAIALLAFLPRGEPLLTFQVAQPWVRLWVGPQALPTERYVAILPFEVTGGVGGPGARALCDGLVEINARKLVRLATGIDSLWVVRGDDIPPDTVTSPRQALDKLGANLAVTGSVMCSGDTITLRADLIDTKIMRRLRHFAISDPMANLATWQDDLIMKLARMIGAGPVLLAELARFKVGCTNVPAAYRPFVRGRGYLYPLGGRPLADSAKAALSDSAVAAFGRAIAEDPSFAQAYAEMGNAYLTKYNDTKAGKWLDSAAVWSQRALRVSDPVPVAALLGAGKIDMGWKRYRAAILNFRRAAELDNGCFEAYEGIGDAFRALSLSDTTATDSAAAALRQAIELQPRAYSPYHRLGYAYYTAGEYEQAVKPFKVLIALRPERSTGYVNLGATYFELHSLPEAKLVFERSLEIGPREADWRATVLSNLGTIYFSENRYAKADSVYNEALELPSKKLPDDYIIYGNRAEANYWMPGRRDTALVMFLDAARRAEAKLAKTPDDPLVMADLASYLSMVGRRPEAEALLLLVAGKNPLAKGVLERVAETYEQLGERDQALVWLDQALAAGYAIEDVERYPNWRGLMSDERFRELRERYRGK
jgi:serine/threonine-protein kinase